MSAAQTNGDADMKKAIAFIILTVLIVCLAAACSAEEPVAQISTTAVTDSEGQTRYYEYVTDENGESVTDTNGSTLMAEIATDPNGTAVTDRSGEYVTENKTVFSLHNKQDSTTINSGSGKTESEAGSDADNEVEFDPNSGSGTTAATEKPTTTTATPSTVTDPSVATTQSATDSDGWINKWY